MKSPFHSAIHEFEALTAGYGFVPTKEFWGKTIVSLMRHNQGTETYTYVTAKIGAASEALLSASLWCAPLEYPNDCLQSLPTALMIPLGETFEEDPEFFHKCQHKVINILPAIPALAEASERETKDPSFLNRRLAYRKLLFSVIDVIRSETWLRNLTRQRPTLSKMQDFSQKQAGKLKRMLQNQTAFGAMSSKDFKELLSEATDLLYLDSKVRPDVF